MKSSPSNLQRRKNIRLQQYDYSSAGAYFVTICTFNRANLFGQVQNDEMILNDLGRIVQSCWQAIPEHFSNISIDEYIVMPNHIHGIICIHQFVQVVPVEVQHAAPQQIIIEGNNQFSTIKGGKIQQAEPLQKRTSLGTIIRSFKSAATKAIRESKLTLLEKAWQRNYYERIIRSDNELKQIQEYIKQNPLNWSLDKENQEHKQIQKALKEVY